MAKTYREISIYPGIEMQPDVEALRAVIRAKGLVFSEEIRPFLRQLIEKHRAEIDEYRKRSPA